MTEKEFQDFVKDLATSGDISRLDQRIDKLVGSLNVFVENHLQQHEESMKALVSLMGDMEKRLTERFEKRSSDTEDRLMSAIHNSADTDEGVITQARLNRYPG